MTNVEKDGLEIPEPEDTRPLYRRAWEWVKEARVTVAGTLGIVAVNLMVGDENLVVHSSDSLTKQMEMAIPSAFGSPEATGIKVLDFGGVTALTGATLEAVRRTSSVTELGATAVAAQMVSCGTDALASQTGLVGDTMDVGSSAIATAWGFKFMLDKAHSAEDDTMRRRWRLGAAAFAGAMTVGAGVFLGGDDGKLDLISHACALMVGGVAYRIGGWRRGTPKVKSLNSLAEHS